MVVGGNCGEAEGRRLPQQNWTDVNDANIQETLKAIRTMFVKSIQDSLMEQHKADQENNNCDITECFKKCERQKHTGISTCGTFQENCDNVKVAHETCRSNVHSLYVEMAIKCRRLHCFDVPEVKLIWTGVNDANIQEALKAVRTMFVKSIQDFLIAQHKADQESHNCGIKECFEQCEPQKHTGISTCGIFQENCDKVKVTHEICRSNVHSLYVDMAIKCGKLHCFEVPEVKLDWTGVNDANIQEAIRTMIVQSIQDSLMEQHMADQVKHNCSINECFEKCEPQEHTGISTCGTFQENCDKVKVTHEICRSNVYSLYVDMTAKYGKLHCFDVPAETRTSCTAPEATRRSAPQTTSDPQDGHQAVEFFCGCSAPRSSCMLMWNALIASKDSPRHGDGLRGCR